MDCCRSGEEKASALCLPSSKSKLFRLTCVASSVHPKAEVKPIKQELSSAGSWLTDIGKRSPPRFCCYDFAKIVVPKSAIAPKNLDLAIPKPAVRQPVMTITREASYESVPSPLVHCHCCSRR